jgi:hypothetical protein
MSNSINSIKKSRIGFLFTGEIRSNPLAFMPTNPNYEILETLNKFVFNEEFKKKYDYDVFISTNSIDINKAFDFFGYDNNGLCNLKNIRMEKQLEIMDPSYVYDIPHKSIDINYFKSEFLKQDLTGYDVGIALMPLDQMYKVYDAFNMLNNYNSYGNYSNYDFICKIRLDMLIRENIIDNLNRINNNPDIQMITYWDMNLLGKPEIMKYYCEAITNKFGFYDFSTSNYPNFGELIMFTYGTYCHFKNDKYNWRFTNEMQLIEHMCRYCEENNLDASKTIKHGFISEHQTRFFIMS